MDVVEMTQDGILQVIILSEDNKTVLEIRNGTIKELYKSFDEVLKKELPKEALTCGIVKQLIRDYEESIELIALDL